MDVERSERPSSAQDVIRDESIQLERFFVPRHIPFGICTATDDYSSPYQFVLWRFAAKAEERPAAWFLAKDGTGAGVPKLDNNISFLGVGRDETEYRICTDE